MKILKIEISPVSIETWMKYAHPDDLLTSNELLEKNFSGELDYYECESRMKHKDGNWVWVLDRGKVTSWTEDGRPVLMMGTHQNITRRKQTEEALLQNARNFSTLVEHAPDIIVRFDTSLRHIYCNQAVERQLGIPVNTIIGKTPFESDTPPEKAEFIERALKRVLETGTELEVEQIFPVASGWKTFQTRIVPEYDDQGRIESLIAISRDITERKRTEESLRKSMERNQTILQTAMDGFWLADMQGRLLEVNEAYCRMSGYTSHELLRMGIPDLEVIESVDDNAAHIQKVKALGEDRFETHHRRKDGTLIDVEISVQYRADEGGQMVAFLRDITERKQAGEEIRRLNSELEQRIADRTAQLTAANQELEAFSYSVSHDLRAPLRSLDGFSVALLEDHAAQLDEQGKQYLAHIQEASWRMGQLINDLIELSRVTRADFIRQRVDLSRLANNIATELKAQSPNRQVEFEINPHMIVQGDGHLLKIVLENLLNNAFKFTSRREHALIQVGRVAQDGKWVYFMRDNGAGFNMDYANKLFGAFQRLHSEKEFPGTGIGLATVQRIIQRHGGRVWADGAVNQGATFYFTLP